jgi:hypothetical protein
MGGNQGARPWLVVVLGLLATGLGHLYLRRFGRAVGWFLAAVAASVLFVPPDAAEAVVSGGSPPLTALAPPLIVSALSVVDAYLLATRARTSSTGGSPVRESSGEGAVPPGAETTADAPTVACPECGRATDPDLAFCQWCAADIGDAGDR